MSLMYPFRYLSKVAEPVMLADSVVGAAWNYAMARPKVGPVQAGSLRTANDSVSLSRCSRA